MVMALAAHGSPASVESAAVQTEGDGCTKPSVGELHDSRTGCVVASPPGSTLQRLTGCVVASPPGSTLQ